MVGAAKIKNSEESPIQSHVIEGVTEPPRERTISERGNFKKRTQDRTIRKLTRDVTGGSQHDEAID